MSFSPTAFLTNRAHLAYLSFRDRGGPGVRVPSFSLRLRRVRARRPGVFWVAFELAFCLPVLCFRGVGPLLFFVEVGLDRFGDLGRRSFACPSSLVRGRPRFPVFLSRVFELTHFFFPRRSPAIFVSSGVAPAGAGVRLRSSGFVRDLELSRFFDFVFCLDGELLVLELTHFFFPRRSSAAFASSDVASSAGVRVRLRIPGFGRDLESVFLLFVFSWTENCWSLDSTHFFSPRRSSAAFASSDVASSAEVRVRLRIPGFGRDLESVFLLFVFSWTENCWSLGSTHFFSPRRSSAAFASSDVASSAEVRVRLRIPGFGRDLELSHLLIFVFCADGELPLATGSSSSGPCYAFRVFVLGFRYFHPGPGTHAFLLLLLLFTSRFTLAMWLFRAHVHGAARRLSRPVVGVF